MNEPIPSFEGFVAVVTGGGTNTFWSGGDLSVLLGRR